jgi:hypothetical protein
MSQGEAGGSGDGVDAFCAFLKRSSLNVSQFVARQYWRKRWATLRRFRAHGVENGAFSSGTSRSL